ncbi:MAG: hypothetical protein BWY66_02029 [bacterium ADurb.Bin374]|nr:MAG: hypothetical protein BWY66_02029 [bacterium ADurb.Bin374]
MLDPEPLLLVDDQQAEILETHVRRQDAVCADQHVELAGRGFLQGLLLVGWFSEPAHEVDRDREPVESVQKRLVMLEREQGGGGEHGDLLAGAHGLERGAHRHFRFAVADIAADQPVHRRVCLHVGLDRHDRLVLVGGFVVGKPFLHLHLQLAVGREREAGTGVPLRIQVEQFARDQLDVSLHPPLLAFPDLRVQAVNRGAHAFHADVFLDLVHLVGRHIQLVGAGILKEQVFARRAGRRHRLDAAILGDAVFGMDHQIARHELGNERLCLVGRRVPPDRRFGLGRVDVVLAENDQLLGAGREAPPAGAFEQDDLPVCQLPWKSWVDERQFPLAEQAAQVVIPLGVGDDDRDRPIFANELLKLFQQGFARWVRGGRQRLDVEGETGRVRLAESAERRCVSRLQRLENRPDFVVIRVRRQEGHQLARCRIPDPLVGDEGFELLAELVVVFDQQTGGGPGIPEK